MPRCQDGQCLRRDDGAIVIFYDGHSTRVPRVVSRMARQGNPPPAHLPIYNQPSPLTPCHAMLKWRMGFVTLGNSMNFHSILSLVHTPQGVENRVWKTGLPVRSAVLEPHTKWPGSPIDRPSLMGKQPTAAFLSRDLR
jgi:hypothetical protein